MPLAAPCPAVCPAAAYRRVSFEARVMAAPPADLAALLYEELVAALRLARRHTVSGHRAGRSAALTRTLTVLNLLDRGLDHQKGGAVAAALARWYEGLRRAVLDQVIRPDGDRLEVLVADARELGESWTAATGRGLRGAA